MNTKAISGLGWLIMRSIFGGLVLLLAVTAVAITYATIAPLLLIRLLFTPSSKRYAG